MSIYLKVALCLQICTLLVSCGRREQGVADQEHPGTSATLWTEKTELFMEYPALIVGEEAAFAVHLSDLKDFKPVMDGQLTCVFTKSGGERITAVADAPTYPGIFRPVVTFSASGLYSMELKLSSQQVSDVIRVRNVAVYSDEASVPQYQEADPGEEIIAFLKEQQWNIDFRTEPAQQRTLASSVRAVGEILPKHRMHAEVPAPVSGVILPDQNANIPDLGHWVRKNEVLAVISPPATTEASLMTVRNEFLLAEAEYQRAERLFEKRAVSARRFDEAKLNYESMKASFDVIAQQVDFAPLDDGDGRAGMHFHLKSPIDGIVEEIHFHIGQTVEAGAKLFSVTNPQNVLLNANVPVARVSDIQNATDAAFKVEGYTKEFKVSQLGGSLVSVGSMVDDVSRTVPVLFQLKNPDNLLKIGMFAEIWVETDTAIEALTILNSAIFDDNGTAVAYVHLEGESFAKRTVETGVTDDGYTQIVSGISAGERVVTVGGYQVRLASLSTSVPVGHGHEH